MNFTFDDVKRITEDVNLDGDFYKWLHEVWNFYIEPQKLNNCETNYDIIGFYRLISGLCKLYKGVSGRLFGDDYVDLDEYVNIDYALLFKDFGYSGNSEDDLRELVSDFVHEYGFKEVQKCLVKANTSLIFASIYYSLDFEDFSFANDVSEVLDCILNEVDADKMTAFEWLKEILG